MFQAWNIMSVVYIYAFNVKVKIRNTIKHWQSNVGLHANTFESFTIVGKAWFEVNVSFAQLFLLNS